MSAASQKSQEPSMEEILASIRRIIADDQDPAKPVAALDAEDEGPGSMLVEARRDDAQAPSSRIGSADLDVEVPDLDFAEAAEPPPVAVAASEPAPSRPAPEPTAAFPEIKPDVLLSSDATASVGQAFHMLSHTVLSRNARTLEDLVKDLLTPMLKSWLDDNLPVLVERLVRTEIERVARGR